MNRQEMLARLAKGENPLDVSIQKWKEVVLEFESYRNAKFEHPHLGMMTCALCEIAYKNGHLCDNCPYYQHYGYDCTTGVYEDVLEAIYREDVDLAVESSKKMIKELEAIKERKE